MKNIYQIIKQCEESINSDINSLELIDKIDFLDIFPKSEIHKNLLDEEAIQIGKLIDKTERGNFYVFNEPIQTAFGLLKIIKIRNFDITRTKWVAAPDFATTNYQNFFNRYKNDERFTLIERPTYKGLEFKTNNSLIYFLSELTTDYYNIK